MRSTVRHRPAKATRPTSVWGLVRGLFAAMFVLAALTVPRASAQAASEKVPAPAAAHLPDDEGGACGEVIEAQELVECGAQFGWSPNEPLALTVLRSLGLHTTQAICDELLADIWAAQTCEARGRECGKLHAGAPPGPPPKLASSTSSAQSDLASIGLGGPRVRRLSPVTCARPPNSRDLQPPVPPPRLASH